MITKENLENVIFFNKHQLQKVNKELPIPMQWVIKDTLSIFEFIIKK